MTDWHTSRKLNGPLEKFGSQICNHSEPLKAPHYMIGNFDNREFFKPKFPEKELKKKIIKKRLISKMKEIEHSY